MTIIVLTNCPPKLRGDMTKWMAVADVFDALTSERVYKDAYSKEKALGIICEGSETQFDPKCVEVFLEATDEIDAVMEKYRDS